MGYPRFGLVVVIFVVLVVLVGALEVVIVWVVLVVALKVVVVLVVFELLKNPICMS